MPGLPSPHPLGELLPAVYLGDDLTQRWTAGLDEVLAPIFVTLDCLDAYVAPATSPPDVLAWLAGWVSAPVDDGMPADQLRALVSGAVASHARCGTAAALTATLRAATGLELLVEESGAAAWSANSDADPPGDSTPGVVVRLPAGADESMVARVERIIAESIPAHLPWRVARLG